MSQNISVTFSSNNEGVVEKKLILAYNTTMQYLLRGEQIKVDIIIKTLDKNNYQKENEEKKENKNIEIEEYAENVENPKKIVFWRRRIIGTFIIRGYVSIRYM